MTEEEQEMGAFWENLLGYPKGSYIGSVGSVPVFGPEPEAE